MHRLQLQVMSRIPLRLAGSLNANHPLSDFAVFHGKLIVITRPAFDYLTDLVSEGKALYVGTVRCHKIGRLRAGNGDTKLYTFIPLLGQLGIWRGGKVDAITAKEQ